MAGASPVSQTRILLGLMLGAVVGSVVNYFAGDTRTVAWIVRNLTRPIGDLFMNLLFLPIVPLVFASLVLSVTRLAEAGSGAIGRIAIQTIAYFLITTGIAAVIGLTAVNLLRPGDYLPKETQAALMTEFGKEAAKKVDKRPEFGVEMIVAIVPRNPLEAMTNKEMLAIIFVAILVGVALTQIHSDKANRVIDLLEAVNQIAEFVIRLAMRVAPVGVFGLIFSTSALFGAGFLVSLGTFVLTVLGGLTVHLVVVLPILVYLLGGMNPWLFFRKIRGTLVTAFSTSSSSATLPTAIKNAEEDLGVPRPVANFVLPLSATMNHNGTALFESVTVLFLAQVAGVALPFDQQVIVLLLCVLTATGMAGVPGGSLPLIGLVLAVVKVDPNLIGLVLGVDRILDMCRTMVNVAADMTTAVFVARNERGRAMNP